MEHSIAEGSFICGSPETVVRQIQKIANQAGGDTFLGEFTFGELTQKQALNSLRLFTEQVMPELRKFDIDALNFPKSGRVRATDRAPCPSSPPLASFARFA